MKERFPYIKRSKYLFLLKKIRKIAKGLNVSLNIYYKPIIWKRYGTYPNFGERRGSYNTKEKKIVVVFYGKIGYGRKLEILLHELRHAIHHRKGLYKDYYDSRWENIDQLLKEDNPKLPCKRTGMLTEMDCNRFAYYWLKKEGITIPKNFKYYKYGTVSYQIHQMFKNKNIT